MQKDHYSKVLEKIQEEWAKDSEVDITELGVEATSIGTLHSKYHKFLFSVKSEEYKLEGELDKLKQILWLYYKGSLHPSQFEEYELEPNQLVLSTKEELTSAINAHQSYIDLRYKYNTCKEIVKFIESILKLIHMRGYAIKTALDYMKFINGAT